MPRIRTALTALIILSAALAACQGQQVKLLDDPKAIAAAAVSATTAATSVHADLKASGTVSVDVLGAGSGVPVDLKDTTASADIDLKNVEARATFAIPGVLGIAGEVIVVDQAMYLKTTLTGPKYRKTTLPAEPQLPLSGLTDLLSRPELQPTKGADAPCAGGTCYTLTMNLTAEELQGLIGEGTPAAPINLPIPMPDLSNATVDLTLHIEQTTNHISDLQAVVNLGEAGSVTLDATFTRWNEPVTISAPPPDQVETTG
jgi:hypothetical protein